MKLEFFTALGWHSGMMLRTEVTGSGFLELSRDSWFSPSVPRSCQCVCSSLTSTHLKTGATHLSPLFLFYCCVLCVLRSPYRPRRLLIMWDEAEAGLVIWKESCEMDFLITEQTSPLHKCRWKSFQRHCDKLSVSRTPTKFNKCLTPDLRPGRCMPAELSRWAGIGNIFRGCKCLLCLETRWWRRRSLLLILWPQI